jgi:hypothetical protein
MFVFEREFTAMLQAVRGCAGNEYRAWTEFHDQFAARQRFPVDSIRMSFDCMDIDSAAEELNPYVDLKPDLLPVYMSRDCWTRVQIVCRVAESLDTSAWPVESYMYWRDCVASFGLTWADECAARDEAVALRFAWIGAYMNWPHSKDTCT